MMVEKVYDEAIVALNERYQELYYSKEIQKHLKREKYKNYIRSGNYRQIIQDILFKLFIRIPSSIESNKRYENIILESNHGINNFRIAVYSCIVGNYDRIIEPLIVEANIDYYMFTDLEMPKNSKWKKIDIKQYDDYKEMTPLQLNRKIKMLPYEYLNNYDYSVYVDGLIEIIAPISPIIANMGNAGLGVHYHNQRDCIYDEAIMIKYSKKADMNIVKKQLNEYRNNGFPAHFGLYENTILVRNHHNITIEKLMREWWKEYEKYPTRDQLELPYLIWKNNINKEDIYIMGDNLSRNPRFNRGVSHKKEG